jgi:hypothetical protein
MALTDLMQKDVLSVWHGDIQQLSLSLTIITAAILDLNAALKNLEAKVERAERLAGRGFSEEGA